MTATNSIVRAAEALLPPNLAAPPARHRAMLVLAFTLSAIIWAPLFALLHYFVIDRPLLGHLSMFAVVHGVLVLAVLRWTGSLALAGHLFSIVLILNLTIFAWLTGGFGAPTLLWAPVVPMTATLLAGRRAGLGWTLFFIAEILGMYAIERIYGPQPSQFDAFATQLNMLMSMIGVQFLSFSLCFCYESIKQRANDELDAEQQTMKQLLGAQEIERQLLAYDIHDGIIQMMTGAAMHLDVALSRLPQDDAQATPEMETARQLLANSIREARRLVGGLRPPILDECGLVAGIEYLIAEHPGLKVRFTHDSDLNRLSPLIETALFRICQESLTNAAKYSAAELVEIRLFRKDGSLTLEVRDDGTGFTHPLPTANAVGLALPVRSTTKEPTSGSEKARGPVLAISPYADAKRLNLPDEDVRFGLQGIRQRARFLGGSADIKSQQGSGTTISVRVPLGDAAT